MPAQPTRFESNPTASRRPPSGTQTGTGTRAAAPTNPVSPNPMSPNPMSPNPVSTDVLSGHGEPGRPEPAMAQPRRSSQPGADQPRAQPRADQPRADRPSAEPGRDGSASVDPSAGSAAPAAPSGDSSQLELDLDVDARLRSTAKHRVALPQHLDFLAGLGLRDEAEPEEPGTVGPSS